MNNTWSIVDRRTDRRALSTKWVFTIKRDAVGNLLCHKARLVARGFEQRQGIDFDLTYAPVARLDSIRTLLVICASRNYRLLQFDISTAFLNRKLDEEVMIEPPAGLEIGSCKQLRLNKALYGLKQAPRAWNSAFDRSLIDLGLKPTKSDPCVYEGKEIFPLIYVDDTLVMGSDKEKFQKLVDKLRDRFKLKQLEGGQFLGMRIDRQDVKLFLSQERYINDMAEKFKLDEARGRPTPISDISSLTDAAGADTETPYRAAIGSLQYLACCTRPDIMFATNLLARFSNSPKAEHWAAAKQLIRYVVSTKTYKLTYQTANEMRPIVFSDADWAGDPTDRKSTSGLVISLAKGPVIFSSRKQTTTAQSSTEAEFEAVKELKWLTQLLNELDIEFEEPVLRVDNHSTIRQIKNNDIKRRSKHIDVKYHFIREQFQNKLFALETVPTEKNRADLLTKPLTARRTEHLAQRLGIT